MMGEKGEVDGFEIAIPANQIIRMMGICRTKFDTQHRNSMLQCGAIFKVKRGRPHRIYIMGFPSEIKRYIAIQAAKGRTL